MTCQIIRFIEDGQLLLSLMDQNQKNPQKEQEDESNSVKAQNVLLNNLGYISQKSDGKQSQREQRRIDSIIVDGQTLSKLSTRSAQEIKKKIEEDILSKYISALQKETTVENVALLKIGHQEVQIDRQLQGQGRIENYIRQETSSTSQEGKPIRDKGNQQDHSAENSASDLLIERHQSRKKKTDQEIEKLEKLLEQDGLFQQNNQSHFIQNQENEVVSGQEEQDHTEQQQITTSLPIKRPQLYTYPAPTPEIQIFKSFYPRYEQKLPRKNNHRLAEQFITNQDSKEAGQGEGKQKQEDLKKGITQIQTLKNKDILPVPEMEGSQIQNDQQLKQQEPHLETSEKEKEINQFMKTQQALEQIIVDAQKITKRSSSYQQEQPTLQNLQINQEKIKQEQSVQQSIVENLPIQHLQQQPAINNQNAQHEAIPQPQIHQSIAANEQPKSEQIYPLSMNLKETSQLSLPSQQIQNQKHNSPFSQISPISLSKAKSLKTLQLSKLLPLAQSLPPTLSNSHLSHSNPQSHVSNQQEFFQPAHQTHETQEHNIARSPPIKKQPLYTYTPVISEAIQIVPFYYHLNKQKNPKQMQIQQIQGSNINQQSEVSEQPQYIELSSYIAPSSSRIHPSLKINKTNPQKFLQIPIARRKLQKFQFLTTNSKSMYPSKLNQKYSIQPDYDINIQQSLKQIHLSFTNSHTNQPSINNLNTQAKNGKTTLNNQIKYETYFQKTEQTPRSIKSNTINYFGSANTGKSELNNSDLHSINNPYNLPSSRWTYQEVSPSPRIYFTPQNQQINKLHSHHEDVIQRQKINEYDIQQERKLPNLKMEKHWSNLEHNKIHHLRPSSKRKRQSYQSERDFSASRYHQNINKLSARVQNQLPFKETPISPLRTYKIKVTQNTKSSFQRKILQTEPNFQSPEKQISPYNASSDKREHQLQQKKQKPKISVTLKRHMNPCPSVSYQESQIQGQYNADQSPIRFRIN